MVSKAIERAQSQVEAQNFEIRKNVLKYDEVMNTQRTIIYKWRNQVLDGDDTQGLLEGWRDEVVEDEVLLMTQGIHASDWDWDDLTTRMRLIYATELDRDSFPDPEGVKETELVEAYRDEAAAKYAEREAELGEEVLRQIERQVVLSMIDNKWREHLAVMDYVRAGIGLRAMGQRDPLTEYQREGYALFSELVDTTKADSLRYLYHVEVVRQDPAPRPQAVTTNAPTTAKPKTVRVADKVGRNDKCPCGSGKKYKQCHGRAGAEPLAG
jgi:preprotein translocase subunit SecA